SRNTLNRKTASVRAFTAWAHRRAQWQAQAEQRLACAEAVVGLRSAGPALPQWPQL
ncbi:hypothetical protein I2485_00840, partial [Nesterenkonia sp. E16_7]|nr:hypothetical protein [Nesterenkonia sp. E16_7]